MEIGGFDERMYGWGYEDCDIRQRLKRNNLKELYIDPGLLDKYYIDHDNDLRTANNIDKDLRTSEYRNKAISESNLEIVVNKDHEWGKL